MKGKFWLFTNNYQHLKRTSWIWTWSILPIQKRKGIWCILLMDVEINGYAWNCVFLGHYKSCTFAILHKSILQQVNWNGCQLFVGMLLLPSDFMLDFCPFRAAEEYRFHAFIYLHTFEKDSWPSFSVTSMHAACVFLLRNLWILFNRYCSLQSDILCFPILQVNKNALGS